MGKGVLGIQEHKLDSVMPTYSHLALVRLMEKGLLKFVVTSNHDDIHSRSGTVRSLPFPLTEYDRDS